MLANMKNTGCALKNEDILGIESYLNVKVPQDYKAFLLRFNGGIPEESCIDFNGEKLNIPGEDIKFFFNIGKKVTNTLKHKMDSIGDNLPAKIIYIANTHGGNFFLLSLRDDSYGSVYYKDHEYEDTLDFDPLNNLFPESIVKVADNFDEFLSRLYDPDDE